MWMSSSCTLKCSFTSLGRCAHRWPSYELKGVWSPSFFNQYTYTCACWSQIYARSLRNKSGAAIRVFKFYITCIYSCVPWFLLLRCLNLFRFALSILKCSIVGILNYFHSLCWIVRWSWKKGCYSLFASAFCPSVCGSNILKGCLERYLKILSSEMKR